MSAVKYSKLFGRRPEWRHPSILARLPKCYYDYIQEMNKPATRVHDEQQKGQLLDYQLVDPENLRIERVADSPVDVLYPEETNEGLWGGEGIVKGFTKHKDFYGKFKIRMLFPNLQKTILYSEILDTYMRTIVTERTLRLIDQMNGFDNYILKTPIQDFKTSQLALDLRRKLLVTLAKQEYYLNNKEKHEYIKKRYQDCVIPLEEAEWIGLPIEEAKEKLKIIEAKKLKPKPLKIQFTKELIDELAKVASEAEEVEVSEDTKEETRQPKESGGLLKNIWRRFSKVNLPGKKVQLL